MNTRGILVAGLLGLSVGCATVPEDAPKEFHEAEASINTMNTNDVDDYLPQTTNRANQTFDQALELLSDSHGETPSATELDAITKAIEAKEAAEGANRIYAKIRGWDSSPTAFQDALAMMDDMDDASMNVAVVNVEPISPFAKLKGSEFVSTLAFFDTNEAQNPAYSDAEVDALVNILGKDTDYQVILTGHADPRGSDDYNRRLALMRAKTIATELESRGVSGKQVIVESAGEVGATSKAGNLAHLQLDRKVQARLVLN